MTAKTYVSTFEFSFDEYSYERATEANILIESMLKRLFEDLECEVECKSLRRWEND